MALLFMDSFDHWTWADPGKWTQLASNGQQITAGVGRRGTSAMESTNGNGRSLIGVSHVGDQCIVGFALNYVISGSSTQIFCELYHGTYGHGQIFLMWNIDGSIGVYRVYAASGILQGFGSLIAVTAPGVLSANVYHYIELKATCVNAGGIVQIRVNGVEVLNLTGQDTAYNEEGWTAVALGMNNSSGSIRIDDLYICDNAGAAPWNTFLGDCGVTACRPTAAGANTIWTPSAGANWQCVDDATPNGDTDYVASTTVGQTDSFVTQDAPAGLIHGVQMVFSSKKMDAGGASIAPIVRVGTTEYPGPDLNPSTAYTITRHIFPTSPASGVAWTQSEFNAAEFGYRKTV